MMGSAESQRVSTAQAAKELGIDIATVRYLMETHDLPIGRVVTKPGNRRKTYLIWRELLDQELGKK